MYQTMTQPPFPETSTTSSPAIQAVIFDMDGLMLDSEALFKRGWMHALEAHGLALDEEVFVRMIGRTAVDSERMLMAQYGPTFPLLDVRVACERWIRAWTDVHGVPLKPGILELLGFLAQSVAIQQDAGNTGEPAPIRLAVATSTARVHAEPRLKRAGLWPFFHASVCGDEVSTGKPSPEIFLRAAERLGVDPRRCVVLEDSQPGIRAAQAAGAIALMVPDLVQPDAETQGLAHGIFPSLREAHGYIAGLLGAGTEAATR